MPDAKDPQAVSRGQATWANIAPENRAAVLAPRQLKAGIGLVYKHRALITDVELAKLKAIIAEVEASRMNPR